MKILADSPFGCDECGKSGPCALIEGTDDNVCVCAECLQKALELLRASSSQEGEVK